jgi:vitamin B12/bleomycin/antimicrobial peptide transport system ATP-binding/permease protein
MTGASGFDWGNAPLNTLWWILKAFAITSIVLVAAVLTLIRTTKWGRQFRRIGGSFFTGHRGWQAWLMLSANILTTVCTVRLSVLFTYQTNDMYSALQLIVEAFSGHKQTELDNSIHLFWFSIQTFAVLAVMWVFFLLLTNWVANVFIIS